MWLVAALPLWIPAFARMTRVVVVAGRRRVCRAPPRVPTRDTPTVVLVGGGMPVGTTGPAHGSGRAPALGVHPHLNPLPSRERRGAMFFLVGQQQYRGDPAGCFGEVLDFVGLEGRRRMVRSR